ncbi:MAG: AI-2E family transporter, partial [Eubacteriales bacterium]|nr:AI-2E family transporter [Eubacteriales bacterium]
PKDMRRHGMLVKNNLFRSLFGQIKSQLMVSLIITTFLILSFVIYGVKYGMLMGFLIGIADALPVIGAGLFLIPWAIISLIVGNYSMGIFLMLIYLGTVLIRQISEPRIVGANLGLYPLATMVAMFAGFQLIGVLGLIVGPILLNLIKVVLEADDISRGVKMQPAGPRGMKKVIRQMKTEIKPESEPEGEEPQNAANPEEAEEPDTEA